MKLLYFSCMDLFTRRRLSGKNRTINRERGKSRLRHSAAHLVD